METDLEFDTTALPVGSVISDVSLSLVVKNSDIGAIGDFSAQRGTWSLLTNTLAAWNAWEPETLAYQTAVLDSTIGSPGRTVSGAILSGFDHGSN